MAGKALKARAAGGRAALGNISNKAALVTTRAQAKQAEKSLITKPVTRLAKSKASSDLHSTLKETVPVVHEEVCGELC